MNNANLVGRLTRPVDLRYTQSGIAYGSFTLAVTRKYKNKDGEREADFINCTAWGKTAETIAEYLRKGRRIALQGRLSVNSYEKNGETRWSTEVIVDKFEFVDTVSSTGGQSSYAQPKKSENSFANNDNNDNDEIMDDDDFPF